jgi:hypothetical protein
MLDAPTTVALAPRSEMPYSAASLITPWGGAGSQTWSLLRQQSRIHGMEAVHILGRVDRIHYSFGTHILRQRQLHQDCVDALVAIESLDER